MASFLRVAAVGDLHCTRTAEGAFQPLFSKVAESADVQLWGYEDARLLPHGSMSEEDASIWTAAIDEAASRPIGADALGGPPA